MKTSTTHRLLNHLQEAVLEGKNAMENVLSSAYDEFSDHLASLAESGLPIPRIVTGKQLWGRNAPMLL